MAQARKISQTFNGLNRWIISGSYLKLLSTVNSVDVKLYLAGQVVVDASQVDQGFYSREAFDRIEITTGASELVTFIVADKEAGSDQFTGSVNSTLVSPLVADNADGQAAAGAAGILAALARLEAFNGASFDRLRTDNDGAGIGALRVVRFADEITKASAAFIGNVQQVGVAAQNSFIQLFNPAGSGIFVYVDRFLPLASAAATTINFTLYNVALATDGGAGVNKDSGGIQAVAHLRYTTNVGSLGTVISRTTVGTGQQQLSWDFNPPIRLGPGEGLAIFDSSVNNTLTGSFEWREKGA